MTINPLISHTVHGDGPGVVLLHGLASSRTDWTWLAPELHDAGYTTYMPDLMGHGDSVKPGDRALYTVRILYALLEDWFDTLPEDGPKVVVGHSLGGCLAMMLAQRRPDKVHLLVLIDPFFSKWQLNPLLRILNRRPDIGEIGLRHAPAWLVNGIIGLDPWTTNNFPVEIRNQIVLDYLRASPHIMYIPASLYNLSDLIGGLQQPSLVIWGERDFTLSAKSFHSLVQQLPRSTGKSIPQCGHQPHLSRPELVNPWIIDYLNNISNE